VHERHLEVDVEGLELEADAVEPSTGLHGSAVRGPLAASLDRLPNRQRDGDDDDDDDER
jgi:hypothetical protein